MRIALFLVLILLTACRIDESISEKTIARVGDNYLYASDLNEQLRDNISSADSVTVVRNYINTWAKEQLLLDKAVFNLNATKQAELEQLIRRYRNDLFIKTYQEEWLKARVDTLISNEEIESYYRDNKQNFKLHQDLMRGRYVELPVSHFNKETARDALRRFNTEDRALLDSVSIQFTSTFLNDSIWVRPQAFFSRINLLSQSDYETYLKSNRFFEIEDSLSLYLVFVEEVRRRNEIAPLVHVRSTLEQVLLNKRKLDMMRQFDREILQEAVKENVFEIYE